MVIPGPAYFGAVHANKQTDKQEQAIGAAVHRSSSEATVLLALGSVKHPLTPFFSLNISVSCTQRILTENSQKTLTFFCYAPSSML